MKLTVAPEVFAALPGMQIVVVVARGVDGARGAVAASRRWRAAWEGAAAAARGGAWPNPQSHPRVRPWRDAWRALGISGKRFPSSVEALLRRAVKGGEPFSIHPVVDFYNAVSLAHVVPAGGFDLAALDGDLELRLTRQGDRFQALDEAEPEPAPEGEIAYVTGSAVLTRHLVWRQSRRALIEPGTSELVLVSEILPALPAGAADEVEADLLAGLEDLGAAGRAGRVRDDAPSLDLD